VTRRFDIGPVLLALGAVVLLIGLFLDWYGGHNAWDAFEVVDLLLAALAVASLAVAVGLLAPELEYLDRRGLPWLTGAAFVLVAAELISKPPVAGGLELGTGAWLSLAAAAVMVVGTVLSLGRVSLAVAVEGRDRRHRVETVDHQPPPTESNPVVRPSESLLHPREAESEPEPPES
jgi:hypothetical protein